MGRETTIELLAARQHGAFSRAQAVRAGFTRQMVQSRLDKGTWIQLDHNVFAINGSPASWHRRLSAALLSRPEAYVAGRSAAHLLGFPGYPKTKPEILLPFPGNARSPLATVIRSRLFEKVAYDTAEGFTVTTPAETLLTLSYREPTAVIERLVDDRLAARQLKIEDFYPILDRLEGCRVRGLPGLRRIVADRDIDAYQPPVSELERLLFILLDRPEVPPYTRQKPFDFPERPATVDAFVPTWAMIVEGDSRRWHTRVQDFEVDRQRDNAAAAAGYITVRFTYRSLKDEADACLDTLLRAGAMRKSA